MDSLKKLGSEPIGLPWVNRPSRTESKIVVTATLLSVGLVALGLVIWSASHLTKAQALSSGVKMTVFTVTASMLVLGSWYSGLKLDTRPAKERLMHLLNNLVCDFTSEAKHEVKSSQCDLNSICGLEMPLPELPNGQIMLINGVAGEEEKLQSRVCELSGYTTIGRPGREAYNVHAVWNATHGIVNDLKEACANIFDFTATESSRLLVEAWTKFYNEHFDDPEARILQICHSQGAAHVRNALKIAPEKIRKRVEVVAIAPGAYIPRELCATVTHYYRRGDPVPMLDAVGRDVARDQGTVFKVHQADGAPTYGDHSMSSASYQPVLRDEISRFVQRMEGLDRQTVAG